MAKQFVSCRVADLIQQRLPARVVASAVLAKADAVVAPTGEGGSWADGVPLR